jgi:hypothetical protein
MRARKAPPAAAAIPARQPWSWGLFLARLAWTPLALGALALFAYAIPARYAQLLTPCAADACALGQVPAGASPALAEPVYAAWHLGLDIAFAAGYVALALLIFAHQAAGRRAIFVSLTLILWGLTFTGVLSALGRHPAWFLPVAAVNFLGAALITLFFYVFPDGRFAPRWALWLALIFIVTQIPMYFLPDVALLNPLRWPPWLYIPVSAVFLTVMIALQVYRYGWISKLAQRRQTKWVVLGITLALSGYVVMLLANYALAPAPGSAEYVLYIAGRDASLLLIPISIAIAVLRDRLYDIDTLINRSLVYGALSFSLLAIYAASVYALGWLARLLTGLENSSLAVILSTLGVIALFQPLRVRIQSAIDRRFYRRRYNAARALAAFGSTLQREVEMGRLTERLLDVVERTMEPTHVSIILLPLRPARERGYQGPGVE